MLSLTINGFTSTQVEAALRGDEKPPRFRVRVALLDARNNVLDSNFMGIDKARSSITHDSVAQIKRTAKFGIVEENLDLDDYDVMVIADGALVYWKLGESSGNLADSSGNSRTLTANGTITYQAASLLPGFTTNAAITPNGTTGYGSIADAAWMDVSRISVEAWIKGTGTSRALIDRDDGSSNRFWRLEITSAGAVAFSVNFTSGSPTRKTFTAPGKVNDGASHHIVATYDGSYVNIYIDGLLAYRETETRTMATGTLAINVGRTLAGTLFSNYSHDEHAIYGRALTPAEVRNHYKRGVNKLGSVDYLKDRFAVYFGVEMTTTGTDGTVWAEWPLGIFLLANPKRTGTQTGIIVDCDGYDQTLVLLNGRVTDRYVVAASTNVATAIGTALAAAGLEASQYSISATTHTMAAAKEWDKGTDYLTIVNDLLEYINYDELRFSGAGVAIGEQWLDPADRAIERTYSDTTQSLPLINEIEQDFNIVLVPNQVTLNDANPGTTTITSTQTNVFWSNDASQGVRNQIVEHVEDVNVVNQTILDALAQRRVIESTEAMRVRINTPPLAFHDHRDILQVKDTSNLYALQIDDSFIELGWTLPLNDAPAGVMTHDLRQIVYLF